MAINRIMMSYKDRTSRGKASSIKVNSLHSVVCLVDDAVPTPTLRYGIVIMKCACIVDDAVPPSATR